MNKGSFKQWLEANTNLKSYSVGRYTGAIETVSLELESYGLDSINLYDIDDASYIDVILNNAAFREKDDKGNRMYSTALKHYKKYAEKHISQSVLEAELLREEKEFERYLTEDPAVIIDSVEDKPRPKPTFRKVNNQKVWKRNSSFAAETVSNADYLCEYDNQHQYFVSKYSKRNYVEAHHLISLKHQDQFDCSLDNHANIVSLCLVCHKKIHYGLFEDKKDILDKLFNSRRERLIKSGINISLEQLYSYY
ncbi:HNH endonuclease [Terribacillus halophilus]|uniref:HNH endonuclease n=1 Tax=Terribacillus halophilus TaxID=361279 RepID=UPI000987032E|nr:hypothetical protein [Terribacillus halophilus]